MRVVIVLAAVTATGCHDLFNLETVDYDGGQIDTMPGLIAYWTMDDVVNRRLHDSVGIHHALCTTCPTPVNGPRGAALMFDGSTYGGTAPGDTGLDFSASQGGSISLWFKLSHAPGTNSDCLVSKVLDGDDDSWGICADGSPTGAVLNVYWMQGMEQKLDGPKINQTDWFHTALTWNGTELILWVDGVKSPSRTANLTFSGGKLVIGGDLDFGQLNYSWIGMLDDIRIYDYPLTQTEIDSIRTPL